MDQTETAILTIDMHHGHLDPAVATLPVPADRAEAVLDHAETLVTRARRAGHPIFHVTTAYRDGGEVLANPKWAGTEAASGDSREDISGHNRVESQGTEIMPALRGEGDVYVLPKKRYSPFLNTDLEFLLRTHGIERLVVAGVNTNTCVQCTCFEATNRDYEVIVVEECVDSMDGEEFHRFGLRNIDRAVGSVVSIDEALADLGA